MTRTIYIVHPVCAEHASQRALWCAKLALSLGEPGKAIVAVDLAILKAEIENGL